MTAKIMLPLAFLLISIPCIAGKKDKSARGVWQEKPIIVDGNDTDWPSPLTSYDEKAKIQYAVSNDLHNLYVILKTSDERVQMKILRSGMQLWIDTTGKRKMTTGIHFPMPNYGKPDMPSEGRPDPKVSMDEMLRKITGNADEFFLEGFKGCNRSFKISQRNGCDINIRTGINEYGELVYEVAVPFRSFYRDTLTADDAGKYLTLCFEINVLKMPGMPEGGQKRPPGAPDGGRPGGGFAGGQMPPGGGPPGGMRGGGPGGSDDAGEERMLSETTVSWTETSIVMKNN